MNTKTKYSEIDPDIVAEFVQKDKSAPKKIAEIAEKIKTYAPKYFEKPTEDAALTGDLLQKSNDIDMIDGLLKMIESVERKNTTTIEGTRGTSVVFSQKEQQEIIHALKPLFDDKKVLKKK